MLPIAPGQGRQNKNIFSIFPNIKVCCVFSLESPHRVRTIYHFLYKKEKSHSVIPNLQLDLQKTQERVRNSCGKRALSAQAPEDLLYLEKHSSEASPVSCRHTFLQFIKRIRLCGNSVFFFFFCCFPWR